MPPQDSTYTIETVIYRYRMPMRKKLIGVTCHYSLLKVSVTNALRIAHQLIPRVQREESLEGQVDDGS